MQIDLEKGISLKINGELGKNQTLPVDALVKIAESLQELVLSIARYDLPSTEAIDLNCFKLELSDFKKSSAVPTFVLSHNGQLAISDIQKQKKEVSKRLNSLLEISDRGNYSELLEFYPEYFKRNEIVERLYNFTSSFNDSPVFIFEPGNTEEQYRPKKFKASIKKSLIVEVQKLKQENEIENAFATIKITKKGDKVHKKINEVIDPHQHSLSYSPEIINVDDKQYILAFPLRCLFEKEDDYYVINNELLGIIGTGITPDEAEINFNEEFDFLYLRLNSLKNDQLSKALLQVKSIINHYVKEVL